MTELQTSLHAQALRRSNQTIVTTPYNILSIDGGGLRGIIAVSVILKLDELVPHWRDKINMYAGTSTGALIAIALAKGLTPQDIMSFYVDKGPIIFSRSLIHTITSGGAYLGAKYDADNRLKVFSDLIGADTKLSDLKKDVVIASFDICDFKDNVPDKEKNWKAKIFHNLKTQVDPITHMQTDDGSELAYMVAMRTSAAPTYFPSYQGFVDGGVFANNPSMCAIAQALDSRLLNHHTLNSINMLSLGTGYHPTHIPNDESWGEIPWAPHFVDLLMDGVNEVSSFEAQQLLDQRYVRVNPKMDTAIPLDDVSQIPAMQNVINLSTVNLNDASNLISLWH